MELFTMYSVKEIITFLIILGGSLAAFLKFCSLMWGYISKVLDSYVQKSEEREVADELLATVKRIDEKITDMEKQITQLEDSDRDDIKGYILDKYHLHVYQKGWIDDSTYQILEVRYSHYIAEGGDKSFIESMMDEIRKLPREALKKGDFANGVN